MQSNLRDKIKIIDLEIQRIEAQLQDEQDELIKIFVKIHLNPNETKKTVLKFYDSGLTNEQHKSATYYQKQILLTVHKKMTSRSRIKTDKGTSYELLLGSLTESKISTWDDFIQNPQNYCVHINEDSISLHYINNNDNNTVKDSIIFCTPTLYWKEKLSQKNINKTKNQNYNIETAFQYNSEFPFDISHIHTYLDANNNMHVKVYSDENTMVCDTQMHPENPGLSTGTFSIELSPEYTRNSKNLKGIFIINRFTKQRQEDSILFSAMWYVETDSNRELLREIEFRVSVELNDETAETSNPKPTTEESILQRLSKLTKQGDQKKQ